MWIRCEGNNLFFKSAYQFLSSDLVDAKAIKSIKFFSWVGVLSLFSWFLYFSFSTITIPYQIEYREGATQTMVQILIMGENPFSLEYQPLGMNNYGIGYSLVTFPFAKLFGNTLLVHRGISLFFLLAILLFIARTIFALKKNLSISILCGIFIVVGLAGRGGLGALPSAMGSFLFLLAILIPFRYSFHFPGLIASTFLSIMAFYTKPYFVICFGIVAIYTFFFISKKKGIFFCLFFLSVFSLFFFGVRYAFKLYFIDTFISNLSNASRSSEHLYAQLREIWVEFYPSIALGVLLLMFRLRFNPGGGVRKAFSLQTDFRHLDTPLFNLSTNYFAFALIFCFLSFMLVLGLHKGSYMTSAYQILLPPFILWLFQTLDVKSRFSTIALGLLFSNALLLDSILLNPSFLLQKDSPEWAKLNTNIRNSHHLVNSPAVVSMMIDAGILPVDSGQTEYYYNIQPYPDNNLLGPSYDAIRRDGIIYRQSIRNAIKNHEFDKLILTDGYANLISLDMVRRYYIKTTTLTIDMPQTHQTWVIGIWEPVSK